MSANDYKPFPRSMDHHLRTLVEQINKEDTDVSSMIYIMRKTIAEVYAAGHQEGFVVGLEHSTMIRTAENAVRG